MQVQHLLSFSYYLGSALHTGVRAVMTFLVLRMGKGLQIHTITFILPPHPSHHLVLLQLISPDHHPVHPVFTQYPPFPTLVPSCRALPAASRMCCSLSVLGTDYPASVYPASMCVCLSPSSEGCRLQPYAGETGPQVGPAVCVSSAAAQCDLSLSFH